MFKDLYKKANDKIPTGDAYLRVMEKVNGEAEKNKYNYAKIAALAACFLLCVSMVSVYEHFAPKNEEPLLVINTPEPEVPVIQKSDAPPVEKAPVVTSKPAHSGEKNSSLKTPNTLNEVTQSKPTENPPSYASEKTVSLVKNQHIPDNIGIGVARFTLGDTVTKDEYYEYLGKNIEAVAVLPKGFSSQTPEEHNLSLAADQNFDDRWTFYFTDDTNSIFITTTKATENVKELLNDDSYEKSVVLETEAVVFEDELQKVACMQSDGIAYTVSSYDISDEDFENLLVSLVE